MKMTYNFWFLLSLLLLVSTNSLQAQETVKPRDALIQAARDIMTTVRYCALISIDSTGRPHARAMDAFAPDDSMIVWLATNPKSRKVEEIQKNPKVSLYYSMPKGAGYVTLNGDALIVSDPQEKMRHWKDEWDAYYKNRDKDFILIKVTPMTVEIVDYENGITSTSATWGAPTIIFHSDR